MKYLIDDKLLIKKGFTKYDTKQIEGHPMNIWFGYKVNENVMLCVDAFFDWILDLGFEEIELYIKDEEELDAMLLFLRNENKKQEIIKLIKWLREDDMSSFTEEHLAEWYLKLKN